MRLKMRRDPLWQRVLDLQSDLSSEEQELIFRRTGWHRRPHPKTYKDNVQSSKDIIQETLKYKREKAKEAMNKELSEQLTAQMRGQRVTFSRVVGTIESVEVEDGRAFAKLSSLTARVPLAECWKHYTREDVLKELEAKRQETTKHEA